MHLTDDHYDDDHEEKKHIFVDVVKMLLVNQFTGHELGLGHGYIEGVGQWAKRVTPYK